MDHFLTHVTWNLFLGDHGIMDTPWPGQVPLERGLLVWKQPFYYWANSELLSQQLAGKGWVCFSLVFRALIWVWEDGQGVLCRVYAAFHSPSSHFLSFLLPLLPPLPSYYSVSFCSCSFFIHFDRHFPFCCCCCPQSLKFLCRQFFLVFSKCVDTQ